MLESKKTFVIVLSSKILLKKTRKWTDFLLPNRRQCKPLKIKICYC